MRKASMCIPLISCAAQVSAAVMLAPFRAGRHRSIPYNMHGAVRWVEDMWFGCSGQALAAQDRQRRMQHPVCRGAGRLSCAMDCQSTPQGTAPTNAC